MSLWHNGAVQYLWQNVFPPSFWTLLGVVIAYARTKVHLRRQHAERKAMAVRHHVEAQSLARAQHNETRQLAEKHHLQSLDRLEAHHAALAAHVTTAVKEAGK